MSTAMSPDSGEEVVTMDEGLAYNDRLCRCNRCGFVARCTLWQDFYTLAFRPSDKHLYCESCLFAEARKDGAI